MKFIFNSKLTSYLFLLFGVFGALPSNAVVNDKELKPLIKLKPTEIQNTLEVGAISVKSIFKNDSLFLKYYIKRSSAVTIYGLGSTSLIVGLDTSMFLLDKAQILKRGAWDAQYNSNLYNPMTVGFDNSTQTLNLNIIQNKLVGIGIVPPALDSMLAEIVIPAKACLNNYVVRFSTFPKSEVKNYNGIDITSDIAFNNAQPNTGCPCIPISLGNDITLCAGFKAVLTFTPNVGVQSVLWQDGTTNLTDTVFGGGVYHVTVKYAGGCLASDTLHVISSLPPTPLIASVPVEKCLSITKTKSIFDPAPNSLTPILHDMVKDSKGNAYITAYKDNRIWKIDANGVKSIYIDYSNLRDPFATNISNLQLNGPYGIAIDRNDNLFITELDVNIIRKITPSGNASIYAGEYGQSAYNGNVQKNIVHLWQPSGIKIDDIGNIYVADIKTQVVRFISPLGYTATIGTPAITGDAVGSYAQTLFTNPLSIAIDKAGYIYVTDDKKTIKKINPFNKRVSIYSVLPNDVSIGEKAIGVDLHKRMYVTFRQDFTVYFVDPRDSTSILYAGIPGSSGRKDGNKLSAQFEDLEGVYVNPKDESISVVQRDRIRSLTDSCGVIICEGYLAQLTVNPHESYEWNNNAAQNGPSISVGTAGKYFVKVGNKVGCTFYDTIQVTVIPKPTITVSKDTVICVGDSSIIAANIFPINPTDTIQWMKNGNLIRRTVGQASNTLKVGGGVYTAEIRTGKLCVYTAISRVDTSRPLLNAYAPVDTVCQGQSVQLKLDVIPTATSTFQFLWTGEIINGPLRQEPTANPISAGDNKYVVKVTDDRGCTNIDSVIIYVKPLPKIITIPDTIVCLGKTIRLETNVSGGKPIFKSQYWFPTTGISDPNILSPTITPTNDITYTVSVTDSDNCTARDEIKIKVAKFEVSPATTNFDTLCPNTVAQLNVSVLEGSGTYTYLWTPNTSLSSNTINNPIANPSKSTVYNVKVRDVKNYCEENRTVALTVINLSVDAGNNLNTCIGTNTNLFANVLGGTKPYQYQWTPNTSLDNASIANPTLQNSTLGSVTYIVTVKDAGGCINKDTIIVNTNTTPIIKTSNDTLVCAGSAIQLIGIVKGATAPANISWSNNLNNQILVGNSIPVVATDSIIYIALLTDANGCKSNIDSTQLAVIKFSSTVTASPIEICPGLTSQLNSNVKGGLGVLKYNWSPGINLNDSTISSPVAKLKKTTSFNVTISDQLGCSTFGSAIVKVTDLVVNAGEDKFICLGNSFQLSGGVGGGTKPYSDIKWTPADGLNITNVLNPTFSKNVIGKYKFNLSVTDALGCKNSDSITLEVTNAPIANAGMDSLTICAGVETRLGGNPTATGGVGEPYGYNWTSIINPSGLLDNNIANPRLRATASGYYTVSVSDGGNCISKDSIYIKVNPLPLVDILKDKSSLCLSDKVLLSIANPSGDFNYAWKSLPNQMVINSTSGLEVSQEGIYRAIVANKITNCRDSSEVAIRFTVPPSSLKITEGDSKCINAPISLIGSSNGDDLIYTWSTINGKGTFSNTNFPITNYNPNEQLDNVAPNSITIKLKVSNNCNSDSILKNIVVFPSLKPSFKTDVKLTLPGEPINFINISDTVNKGKFSFQWSFGDGMKANTYNASHIYGNYGNFLVMLTAQNQYNCVDTASMMVEVISSQIFYIPNAFAPSTTNAENKSAKIYGVALAPEGFEWVIYNRWGEVIFTTTNTEDAGSVGWNGNFKNTGELLPMGVYTYTLRGKFADGKKIEKTGTISLIR